VEDGAEECTGSSIESFNALKTFEFSCGLLEIHSNESNYKEYFLVVVPLLLLLLLLLSHSDGATLFKSSCYLSSVGFFPAFIVPENFFLVTGPHLNIEDSSNCLFTIRYPILIS